MTSISVNRSKHHHIKEACKRTIAAFSTMSTNTADGDGGVINLGAALTTLSLVLLLAAAVILCKYTAAFNTLWYVLGVGRLCDVCICIGLCAAVLTVPWAIFMRSSIPYLTYTRGMEELITGSRGRTGGVVVSMSRSNGDHSAAVNASETDFVKSMTPEERVIYVSNFLNTKVCPWWIRSLAGGMERTHNA